MSPLCNLLMASILFGSLLGWFVKLSQDSVLMYVGSYKVNYSEEMRYQNFNLFICFF